MGEVERARPNLLRIRAVLVLTLVLPLALVVTLMNAAFPKSFSRLRKEENKLQMRELNRS